MRIILLFIFLTITSCTSSNQKVLVENSGFAQGTTYQIKYLANGKQNFGDNIKTKLAEIDSSMSTYVPTSLISQVNKGDTLVEVDSIFMRVLDRSLEIAKETNGAFDPTIGTLAQLWGFGFDEIRQDVTEEMIHDAKRKTGYDKISISQNGITIPEGFSLDFNAIAQGFTVDYISEYLEEMGIEHYMVEVGGEIRTRGVNENGNIWKIGVDKPQEEIDTQDRFQFILELNNASLATSGNYRKFWIDEKTGMRYAHTIDPHTGRPALNNLLSATIIAPTAMDADAYATACMVMGLEACKQFISTKNEMEAYLVYSDSGSEWNIYLTDGFDGYIVE